MAHKLSILVIDDEPQIQRLLKIGLTAEKFKIVEARTAAAALKLIASETFDVFILDIGLPDENGLAILPRIRDVTKAPVIVLSAGNDEDVKVKALDLGADDYVTKPFSLPELMARIRVTLRHRFQSAGASPVQRFGDVEIDLVNRTVSRAGKEVALSRTEFDILRLLAEHQGKILTHDYILRSIRGEQGAGDPQYLRVYVRTIRQKLGDKFGENKIIRTEMGIGYRMVAHDRASTRDTLPFSNSA